MRGFMIGLGLGVGLGILFAPMSGEETRNNLSQRASEVADSAREAMEEGREKIRTGMAAVRGERPTGTESM